MADKTKTTLKAGEEKLAELLPKNRLTPRETEKTYHEQTRRTYAFFVDPSASKQSVAKKVAEDFNVVVESVRVLTRKGKKCRFSKGKHAYPGTSFRRDHKLAYVTLKEGNSIPVFKTEEKADAKADKKADKKAKKEAKADAKEAKTAVKADKNASKEKN